MKVTVRLFGSLAEQAGAPQLEVAVLGATVGEVVDAVRKAAPSLRIDRAVRFAVNADYAESSAAVREGDVVSLLPPVGGG